MQELHKLNIVLILTFGFGFASLLGYITHRIKLSPILGYLIAGYFIGPYSPGFVADLALSEQLAEIGVILMMFGVGLHFDWKDLVKVKNIAIPGAVGQTFATSIVGAILIYYMGWPWEAGIVFGIAIAIASTVVLVRVLTDNNLLPTPEGHITVGWLVVEDILTIFALILLPIIASTQGVFNYQSIAWSIGAAMLKFSLLIGLLFTLGSKFITFAFAHIARTRSHELFTLTLLALTFVIAVGSAFLFGTSIALGAFLAGMIIGKTDVNHQAAAYATPLKDVFSVIFFLAVGMLFNPFAIINYPFLFISTLAIILIIKPLVAYFIVVLFKYPIKTALTVALALAQIGEFSFILAEEASRYDILPDAGYDIIVACALVSISINPLFFKSREFLNRILTSKSDSLSEINDKYEYENLLKKALVIGFGPIGQGVVNALEESGFHPIIIDRNIDTITKLKAEKKEAVYGDATHTNILKIAQINIADLLVITIPDIPAAILIIKSAQNINPTIPIIVRANYIAELKILDAYNVKVICEEQEESNAFNATLLNFINTVT